MRNVVNNIEDLIEILVGLQGQAKMNIESSDVSILNSIARQVFKGTALTDRQFALVQEKLMQYKDQFTALEYEFDSAVNNLRMPLRQIDRSQYIKLISQSEMVGPNGVYESHKENWMWIKVRFPFSKKNILLLDNIQNKNSFKYEHKKGTHEHYYQFNEISVWQIVSAFKNKNFIIDEEILEYYEKICIFVDNKNKYIPGVYNLELKNLPALAQAEIEKQLGPVSIDNLAHYKDRALMFGLQHFDNDDLDISVNKLNTLSQSIVKRKSSYVLVNRTRWTLNNLIQSLIELERFPLMIVIDEDVAFDQLTEFHQLFRNFINNSEVSVIFRLDNTSDDNKEFNNYIKDNNLNNLVDKNTKIVYISKSKIPKTLVKQEWRPSTVLTATSSRSYNKFELLEGEADLCIHYDTDVSPFYTYSKKTKIEKI